MRIKSLQLHGFKSFVDRTSFVFQDGVTAVVGPNGCGKSNVVDAVRWVMGEQSPRRLRGKGMDDVIFQGSDARPPIGMAEVVLTFDNSDGKAPAPFALYSEIQIARRLYRSGESEYLINRTPCRLRDVLDFFRDTGIGAKGYTIVEQGRIAEIVSAKPEERRILIEEAAGISKYKARRREAEGKIASTEGNLVRVDDVLGEIRRQISTLERQARKAARYKRLQERLRMLELSLAADERRELLGESDGAGGRLRALRDKVTALETRVSERDLFVEERKISLVESEKAVAQGAERLYALRSEIRDLEGRVELGRREREGLGESNTGRREELAQLREQLERARDEASRAGEELERIEATVRGEAESINGATSEAGKAAEALRALEREREQSNEAFVEVLTRTARSEDRTAAVEDRRAEIDQRARSADRDLEVHQSEAVQAEGDQRTLEEGLRNLLADRDRLQDQLIKALNHHERAVQQGAESAHRLRGLRERHEARKARLDSLREVIERREDMGAATRHLLEGGDEVVRRYGVRGLVRDLLEVDPEVETAVEAVLAERAEALVVERMEGAVDALEALRDADVGRGVFLVEPPPASVPVGIVPLGEPLLDRVRPRPGFEGVARALLGGVNLVPTLAEALRTYGGGRLPAVFVTPAGDVLHPDGVVRGGGGAEKSGSLGRVREVRELEAEVVARTAELDEFETRNRQAESELAQANEQLDNLRNRHHTAALAVANHEKDLERTRERVKALGEVQEGRVAERSELLAESESLVQERERLDTLLRDARTERASRQRDLDALGLRIHAAARESQRLESRLIELRVAHDARVENRNRLAETAGRAAGSLGDTTAWISRREQEIAAADTRREELLSQIQEAESGLSGKLEEEETARVGGEQRRHEYDRQAESVREIENEVRELRTELGARREEASGAELSVRESELHLRHLDEAIREKWQVDLATWTPPDPDAVAMADPTALALPELEDETGEASAAGESEDAEATTDAASVLREARANAELTRLSREERERHLREARDKIQSLGDVNLGAIEEHEELAERARFLGEQKADLESTIRTLREAIARINRTGRRRFRETFEEISKRFSENFPRMFGGGKGSLMLTDHEDVLEAGIDIMAQPPGKRLQNVNLLSGGEKTMTAIALLVAVFQVRPSPFFLLDEVDAALDDANVGRFNQLVTELAVTSQFLIITHNKRTIEVADVLYGVTMEQKGVSKLVAVELH
ncbi:MAG: chromosome segregation protein SMC [Proteobacteria bacterium]|nr:chromosome segregation protein SMC [Pseudomonadota bacterium]